MSRSRRIKPSTVEGRKRQAELGKNVSNPRTSKADRAAALEELDRIAPVKGTVQEKSILLDSPPAKPSVRQTVDELAARVKARRAAESNIPSSLLSSVREGEWLIVDSVSSRERAIERARNATPQEKAAALIAGLPEHPLNKLAAELARYIWTEDRSNPRPDFEMLTRHWVKHWLSDDPWNRHDVRGSRATVDAAVADALRLVAERESTEPGWFVRRAERLLDSPPTPPQIENVPSVEVVPEPEATVREPGPIKMDPIAVAGANLAARAAILLKTDSWLSHLAEHSPDMRAKILASLSDELLRTGFVSGDFCARLYNDSRPRALSQFPPRQF